MPSYMFLMLSIVRTNNPTSIRFGHELGYIIVCATPPNRLTFWNGTPKAYISGIRVMPLTLDRMYGRSLCPVGHGWICQWPGWINFLLRCDDRKPRNRLTLCSKRKKVNPLGGVVQTLICPRLFFEKEMYVMAHEYWIMSGCLNCSCVIPQVLDMCQTRKNYIHCKVFKQEKNWQNSNWRSLESKSPRAWPATTLIGTKYN